MKNFIQPGKYVEITAPAAVTSGDLVLIDSLAGVIALDAASGERVNMSVMGVYALPKTAGVVFAEGQKVYFDDANPGQVIDVDGGGSNALIGAAVAAAAGGDATAEVRLDGVAR